MQAVPLPPPYGGVNEGVPVVAIQSPECENLLNFNTVREGVSLRYGDSKYAALSFATNDKTPLRLFAYGSTKLFLLLFNGVTGKVDIRDVDAAVDVFSSSALGADEFYTLYFNNYLYAFGEMTYVPGFVYDGTNWGSIGWTGSGFSPIGGDVYRRRAFLIQRNEAAYWYTGIDAITGAVSKVDLTTIISEKTSLAIIAPITIAESVESVVYQAFVFFSGEVLFYEGSYPDSSNWQIYGRAKIAPPLNYNSGISYQGDYLVLTDVGVVSLRDLFLSGSKEAASLTVSAKVRKTWMALVQARRTAVSIPVGRLLYVRGIYDSKNNRLIISFPCYISNGTAQNGSYYFVFDAELQSWFFHRSFGAQPNGYLDIVQYLNKVLTVSYSSTAIMIYSKEGSSGFTDRSIDDASDVGVEFEAKSAPIASGRTFIQKADGLDAIVTSDMYPQVGYRFISDLGVNQSATQIIPTQASTLQKTNADIGLEGSYIQYKISGTTTANKTVGYNLFGLNLWTSQGKSPR